MTVRTSTLRRSLAAALTLGVAVSLAACSTPTPAATDGGSDGGSKPLRIGFSPFTLQVPALKGLADGLTAAGQGAGDTVLTADPKGDPSTQLQQLTQWIDLGQVDAVWIIPSAPPAVASAITDAQSKGIVVIASGVPTDYGFPDAPMAGVTFTNVDNADYGSKLGGLAAQCITDRLDGKGNIIYVASPSGAQSSDAINDAVKDAIANGAADSKIVSSLESAADRLGNSTQISSALQGNPDANVIIGTDDEATLGALDSLDQAGIDPTSVCVVGAGGNDEAKADVTAGTLYGEVAFDFMADLGQNLGELHKLAADPTANGSQLTTPIQLITK